MRVGNITLRDYQQRAINGVRRSLRNHDRVILQSGTGSGKTAMGLFMMHSAVERGNKALFIVHQRELLAQTEEAFWKQGLAHGVIAPNRSRSRMPAQLAMIQTLTNRVKKGQVEAPDLIIIDECHRSLSPTYLEMIEAFPRARIVGLTATPERTDGKPLGEIYQDIVLGPPIRQLINEGHLCDYELYCPTISGADADGVGRRGHDYDLRQLAERFDSRQIFGDAVSHYQRLTPNKRAVVMCASVALAHKAAEEYRDRGIPAACMEGSMSSTDRAEIIRDLGSGKLRVVTNMNLLVEGVDIPAIEVVQWLRPTLSPIIWGQGCGRGFRPAPGKDHLVILDHVANFATRGLPCEEREYSLTGRSKPKVKPQDQDPTDNGPSLSSCAQCFKVYEAYLSECPYCGHENEDRKARKLKQVAGELQKVEIEKAKQARIEFRQRQGQTRDMQGLIRLFFAQGGKNPDKRAVFTIAGREGRSPTHEDFREASIILRELQNERATRGLL